MTNESKRDWNNLLTAKDFWKEDRSELGVLTIRSVCATEAAHIANEIIRKELEKAPRVYGTFTEDLKRAKFSGPLDWTERYHPQPSHTARLICIEEIKK